MLEFIFQGACNDIKKTSHKWQTPSNIALVKYWGKTHPQLPKNASISFTLNNCNTRTRIDFNKKQNNNSIEFEIFFEGKIKEEFKPKIADFFDRIKKYCPYIYDYRMVIYSENSFPHSSGIASSASGMSAIAMCIMNLEKDLNPNMKDSYLKQKASFLARLGSGSASRSIEGPLVVWGKHLDIAGSSDNYAIKFPYKTHPVFDNYQDCILIVDKGEKDVSSTLGHNLMHNHPFAEQRFKQANDNLKKISDILQNGNLKEFISLVESEALSLHAMMLTSNPYFVLMKPKTLEIINKIWNYRRENDSNICFTLDAGANVHLLYPLSEKKEVDFFIKSELLKFCQKNHYICDYTGSGSKKINS
ncbi:diphosphomevalonate/mevalonate 3,5-bisphosphate decarboxylase family protein [Tenacibaculum sp. C7A-26P2]|uniref:diphosphomevalonate/mevalonate 3,5-bisphosphate decarboxylase family protein n=1 Tax=Tenacibaculum sp. C7A-26P2 TaxID=3447504 RepID=UPI003F85ACC5